MPTNSKKSAWYKKPFLFVQKQLKESRQTNPHRSLKLTRRRDYTRSLTLPHVIPFTVDVTKMLWREKKIFIPLIVIYIVLYVLLVGAGSQDAYSGIVDSITEAGEETAGETVGVLGATALTFVALISNGINSTASEAQQIFGVLLIFIAWLATIWLLRNILAGNKVKMRDGLYNSGAPIIPTMIIGLVIALQLLPVAIAAVGYSAAVASGLLTGGGIEAMLFWVAASLLGVLSAYWITSSLYAMVIVTLPGMYPMKALKAAGKIVMGRRIRLLLRWVWMIFIVFVLWFVVLFPVILFDAWIKDVWPIIDWIPVVPVLFLLLSAYTVFWVATYVYLLYRKVVDDNEEA